MSNSRLSSWGTKHVCRSCGAKFYDLHKSPAICPKCQEPISQTPAAPKKNDKKKVKKENVNLVPVLDAPLEEIEDVESEDVALETGIDDTQTFGKEE